MKAECHFAFSEKSLSGSNRAAKFEGSNPCTYLTFVVPYEGYSAHFFSRKCGIKNCGMTFIE